MFRLRLKTPKKGALMPEISLTDFVNFVTRIGSARLTLVREIRSRGDYDPIRDFWRDLRDGLVTSHRDGLIDKHDLDELVNKQPEPRREHYRAAVAGYKRFLGRKSAVWFEPQPVMWQREDLGIRVNPELGLLLNGQRTVIKLHFRSRSLSKRQIECILLLMEDALRPTSQPGDRFAVLDVQSGKLFVSEDPRWGLRPFLVGEAQAFLTMWREIDREERLAAAERWAAERPVPAPALRLSGEALLRVGG